MTLTNQELLERIAPYLPYRVKAYDENQDSKTDTIVGIFRNTLDFNMWSPENSNIDIYKIVLRPISDLNKPCLEGGKVPIDLFDVYEENNFEFTDIQTYRLIVDIAKHGITHDVKWLPYGVIQQLYKWHFDIHGLIEQGYAIDINTLSNGN